MPLTPDAHDAYWFLTETEFAIGTLNLSGYEERVEVFSWLVDREGSGEHRDPREGDGGGWIGDIPDSRAADRIVENVAPSGAISGDTSDEQLLELIPTGLRHSWCFTKNDADFYPSIPHGHLNVKTNPWPKLDPYVGRAFIQKHAEDKTYRLNRREMIILWNDKSFRRHALETIAWYSETFPYYRFPVANRYRLPRWRRR